MPKGRPASLIDVEIGRRLRGIRIDRKLTQEELGEKMDVSYQQIQKYETGHNRISAGRLWSIARVLGCTVADLLPDETFVDTNTVEMDISANRRNVGHGSSASKLPIRA